MPTWFSQVLACAMRLDPAKRMQTCAGLMSALTDPNVANAMFERGDNQISTRKIMAVSLVVIFVLVVLLLWSLAGRQRGTAVRRPPRRPTAARSSGGECRRLRPCRTCNGAALYDRHQGQRCLRRIPHRHGRSRAPTPCRRALSSVRTRPRARKS